MEDFDDLRRTGLLQAKETIHGAVRRPAYDTRPRVDWIELTKNQVHLSTPIQIDRRAPASVTLLSCPFEFEQSNRGKHRFLGTIAIYASRCVVDDPTVKPSSFSYSSLHDERVR